MVILESHIKRFIGDSWDPKPTIGKQVADGYGDVSTMTANDLPVGSTLYLADLGIIERWNGDEWTSPDPDTSLDAILSELVLLRTEICALRLGMMEAGTCGEASKKHIERALDAH